jgi:hypothetical protein
MKRMKIELLQELQWNIDESYEKQNEQQFLLKME